MAHGAKVTVRFEDDDEEESYYIVGSQEADPDKGRISDESPIGRALMGKKVGDTAIVEAPAGKLKYTVVNITA